MVSPSFSVLGVIPARGGSKGIPRKNLRLLDGRPLLSYTVEAALQATSLAAVVVSTEDDEIAQLAERLGSHVVRRPPELAGDSVPTEPVLIHALAAAETQLTSHFDAVALLQCTSPLRSSRTIDECVSRVREGADSVLTVCADHSFLWLVEDGRPNSMYDYRQRPRRQDLIGRQYRENGAVYVTRRSILLAERNRLGGRIEIVEMNANDSIDIDALEDLTLAELRLRSR